MSVRSATRGARSESTTSSVRTAPPAGRFHLVNGEPVEIFDSDSASDELDER